MSICTHVRYSFWSTRIRIFALIYVYMWNCPMSWEKQYKVIKNNNNICEFNLMPNIIQIIRHFIYAICRSQSKRQANLNDKRKIGNNQQGNKAVLAKCKTHATHSTPLKTFTNFGLPWTLSDRNAANNNHFSYIVHPVSI